MKDKDLKQLLEKYYSGESTEEDEIFLNEYFNGNSVSEGYEAEKLIFRYFEEEKNIPPPAVDFEIRIMEGVDRFNKKRKAQELRTYLYPVIGVAASILLILGAQLIFSPKEKSTDTYDDPQIAYAETRRILYDVSIKLNRGKRSMEPVGKISKMKGKSFEAINKSTEIISKSLKNLDYLNSQGENQNNSEH